MKTFSLLGLILVFAPISHAQTTAPVASAQTLKVTTRLVQVNVLVHDHHGNPIENLTKDDFEVTDAGKRKALPCSPWTGFTGVPLDSRIETLRRQTSARTARYRRTTRPPA